MKDLPATFLAYPSSAARSIDDANLALNFALPSDYLAFMSKHDGGEGFVGKQYLILWRSSELKRFNDEYEFPVYAPALIAFGSDGGGEAFAFDSRVRPCSVVMVPFIGMSHEDAVLVAPSFERFLHRLKTDAGSLFDDFASR